MREWMTVIIVATVTGILIGLLLLDNLNPSVDVKETHAPVRQFYPVNSGICVFISDAASGIGRESALMLADSGVHVLAGEIYSIISLLKSPQ